MYLGTVLYISAHGGGCCGIRHLRSFGNYNSKRGTKKEFVLKSLDDIVKSFLPDNRTTAGINGCNCPSCIRARAAADPEVYAKRQREWITAVECVLAGSQYEQWKDTLEECGFKEVFSFRNSNSSNMCHVFYGTTNPAIKEEDNNVESAPSDAAISS